MVKAGMEDNRLVFMQNILSWYLLRHQDRMFYAHIQGVKRHDRF